MSSYFVLWSGGIDSTFMILRLLELGHSVEAGYVEIQNNQVKTRSEQSAIALLQPLIKDKYPSQFKFHGTIYSARNYSRARGLLLRQLPYFIHALMVAPPTDFRALGYVGGDSAIKRLADIRKLYNSYRPLHFNLAPLCFPIKQYKKEQIAEHLKEYYPSILQACWWCERQAYSQTNRNCGECTPCKRAETLAL